MLFSLSSLSPNISWTKACKPQRNDHCKFLISFFFKNHRDQPEKCMSTDRHGTASRCPFFSWSTSLHSINIAKFLEISWSLQTLKMPLIKRPKALVAGGNASRENRKRIFCQMMVGLKDLTATRLQSIIPPTDRRTNEDHQPSPRQWRLIQKEIDSSYANMKIVQIS